jgi:cellulose synthase/poly-beta-1,6-N-acetylglucosamine synthase-like glycosyltransferase
MQLIILSISLVLFTLYAVLIIYYTIGWKSIPPYYLDPQGLNKNRIASPQPTPINEQHATSNEQRETRFSIIIPARNEEKNIRACLDSICGQNYSKDLYEVIVVDDHSTDGTADIVNNYAAKNIRLISLREIIKDETLNAYKKKAIEIGIARSNADIIVTTDADCIVPENWLKTIASFYKETNAAFIAMPVSYACDNNFIEIFQALDFMTLQGITGASVHKRVHSMCNGANLAYSKPAFYEVNGFKGIDNIASGDDMLLMHKIYKKHSWQGFLFKVKGRDRANPANENNKRFFQSTDTLGKQIRSV